MRLILSAAMPAKLDLKSMLETGAAALEWNPYACKSASRHRPADWLEAIGYDGMHFTDGHHDATELWQLYLI